VRTAFQSLLAPPASELAAGVRGNPVDFRSGTSTQMKTPGRRYLEIASVRYPSAFSAGYQTPVDRSHAGLFRRVRLGPASWNLSDSPGSSRSAPLRSPRTTEPQLSALSGRLFVFRPQCRPADLTHYKPGIPKKEGHCDGSEAARSYSAGRHELYERSLMASRARGDSNARPLPCQGRPCALAWENRAFPAGSGPHPTSEFLLATEESSRPAKAC